MPGWIWVCLVIFLLLVLVAGGLYVFLQVKKGLTQLSPLSRSFQKDLAQIRRASDEPAPQRKPIMLARSLSSMRQDYEDAHTSLLRHKNACKAQRDSPRWERWAVFGTADEQKTDPQVRADFQTDLRDDLRADR